MEIHSVTRPQGPAQSVLIMQLCKRNLNGKNNLVIQEFAGKRPVGINLAWGIVAISDITSSRTFGFFHISTAILIMLFLLPLVLFIFKMAPALNPKP